MEGHFKKVLLKLSSKVKLRNFDTWNEDSSSGTTSLVCAAIIGFCISFGVVAIALSIPMVMRRPDFRIKQ